MTTKHYVLGFMFTPDERSVVLIQKARPSWQVGLLNGVGGAVEAGESLENAMSREFLEETGVNTEPDSWTYFHRIVEEHPRDITQAPHSVMVSCFYTYNENAYQARTRTDESVRLCPVSQIFRWSTARPGPRLCISNLRWLIPLALDTNECFSRDFDSFALSGRTNYERSE